MAKPRHKLSFFVMRTIFPVLYIRFFLSVCECVCVSVCHTLNDLDDGFVLPLQNGLCSTAGDSLNVLNVALFENLF